MVSNLEFLLIQDLHEVHHQPVLVLILGLDELLELGIEFADGIFSCLQSLSQGGDLLSERIRSRNHKAGPLEKLDGLIVILHESNGGHSLLWDGHLVRWHAMSWFQQCIHLP